MQGGPRQEISKTPTAPPFLLPPQRRSVAAAAAAADPAYDYDLFTIGAGSGGVRASRFAASTYGERGNGGGGATLVLPF